MSKLSGLASVGLLAASAAAWSAPAANLSVTFVHPEKYVDASYRGPLGGDVARAEVQDDIEHHLQKLAAGLPAGEALKIEVLDINLAGGYEPFRFNGSDVRVMRDVTWPQIELRYTLTRDDRVVTSAEERLADLNYLRGHNRYADGDRLRYEKAMLDDWFQKRISGR